MGCLQDSPRAISFYPLVSLCELTNSYLSLYLFFLSTEGINVKGREISIRKDVAEWFSLSIVNSGSIPASAHPLKITD